MQTQRKFIFQLTITSALVCFGAVSSAFADGCNLDQATVDSESRCQQMGTPSPDPGLSLNGDELRFKKSVLPPKEKTGEQDSTGSSGAISPSGASSAGSPSDVPRKPLKDESSCTNC
jgi:hypothetical protein